MKKLNISAILLALLLIVLIYTCTSEKKSETIDYKTKGLELALSTKAILGKNLVTAINEQGTEEALAFCNTKAIQLTDSMAIELDASIKRVSDKNRNPFNAANAQELKYIQSAIDQLATNGKIKPEMHEFKDKVVGYYPITTNTMCLQCHGEPKTQVKDQTLAKINTLYPEDKALGYSEDELRGIWVVEMKKN